jgi:hypothetical protein
VHALFLEREKERGRHMMDVSYRCALLHDVGPAENQIQSEHAMYLGVGMGVYSGSRKAISISSLSLGAGSGILILT